MIIMTDNQPGGENRPGGESRATVGIPRGGVYGHGLTGPEWFRRSVPGKVRQLTEAAVIAALYVALTFIFASTSFFPQQLRVSEALSILPAFTPAAIPGLFIGCALANTLSAFGIYDLIFGSAASLIAAALTRLIARLTRNGNPLVQALLLPFPAVIVNAVVIGAMISILDSTPFFINATGVFTGQALSCYALGVPLYVALRKLTTASAARRGKPGPR